MKMEHILEYLQREHLDAFLVLRGENIRYLTGYTGGDALLLVTPQTQWIFTDPRNTEQAALDCPECSVLNWKAMGDTKAQAVAAQMEKQRLSSLAFDADAMSYLEYQSFSASFPHQELLPVSGLIEELRSVKTPWEIENLRSACDISCRALRRLVEKIRVGITERELSAWLALYQVQEGADGVIGNITISGAKTSQLHGIANEKSIEYGDFVLIDFSCKVQGYFSDMTRTFVVGKATQKQREVYGLEQRMVQDALEAIRPGVPCCDILAASEKAIAGTPYWEYHYNNVGHGLGLSIHEQPMFNAACKTPLAPGHVLTIEPGIYIPGWGGVRIEDQVLVTQDGYENLVDFPRDLMEL